MRIGLAKKLASLILLTCHCLAIGAFTPSPLINPWPVHIRSFSLCLCMQRNAWFNISVLGTSVPYWTWYWILTCQSIAPKVWQRNGCPLSSQFAACQCLAVGTFAILPIFYYAGMLGALGQFLFFLWEYLDLLANFFCLFLRFLYPSDLGKAYPTHKKNKSSYK